MFAVSPVDDDPAGALADARAACDTKPVRARRGGFACVEHKDDDLIVGNVVARGRAWVIVIVGKGPDRDYGPQLKAVVALLGAVKR